MKKTKKNRRKRLVAGLEPQPTTDSPNKSWTSVKRRVTQDDVNQAAERTEVEQQATLVDLLRNRVADLQTEQTHLESRLQNTRSDIATAMLQHAEATQKFKDMTALKQQVP